MELGVDGSIASDPWIRPLASNAFGATPCSGVLTFPLSIALLATCWEFPFGGVMVQRGTMSCSFLDHPLGWLNPTFVWLKRNPRNTTMLGGPLFKTQPHLPS